MSQKFYPITCQSCGMPMKLESDFGTNANGSKNEEYCTYCYQKGQFTNPNITMDQMIIACVGMMVKYGTPEAQAREQMQKLVPTLKRWSK